MQRLKKAMGWISVMAAVTGCAPLSSGMYGEPAPKPMVYAYDAVKRINPSVTDVQDPSMMQQSSYPLGPNDHLLVRFNHLKDHARAVRTDGTNQVHVRLTVIGDNDAVATAAAAVSVCPLTHDFMMYATWLAASQFGHEWRWAREGGDYDDTECEPGTVSTEDPKSLVFNVTQWFDDYPKARSVNFGQILISTKPVTIAGNTSGGGYPRLLWSE